MSRTCEISGKKVMSGNNVSHAKNKTKRKFLPNLQNVKFFSKSLDRFISMKVSVRALRSVEKKGNTFEVDETLLDDLNTPGYIAKIHELYNDANKGDEEKKLKFNQACKLIGLFNISKKEWESLKKRKISFLYHLT